MTEPTDKELQQQIHANYQAAIANGAFETLRYVARWLGERSNNGDAYHAYVDLPGVPYHIHVSVRDYGTTKEWIDASLVKRDWGGPGRASKRVACSHPTLDKFFIPGTWYEHVASLRTLADEAKVQAGNAARAIDRRKLLDMLTLPKGFDE